MRVLHVSSGNLYGGVETLLATLSKERHQCPSMEPDFALCFRGLLSKQLAEAGTPATDLGGVQTRFPWQIWRARRRLARLLQEQSFDVVVCHMPWAQALFGPVVRRAERPLVYWMHDVAGGTHWIERWAAWCPPDEAICNSQFTAGSLPELFPRRTPPHEVLLYPVSKPPSAVRDRAAVRAALGTSADACVIIQVSRMEPYKGGALHLDALAHLVDVPGWECWFVGGVQRPHEAAFLADLQARAERTGISGRVRFLGQRRDVPELLAAADVFCQPNLRGEPFGIVFIEAMYAGLPVVSTAMGGAMEIVAGSVGKLVPSADPLTLADCLLSLVRDRPLREKMGRMSRAHASSISEPAKALERLRDTLAKRLSNPPGQICFAPSQHPSMTDTKETISSPAAVPVPGASKRNFGLDVIRAAAIGLVVIAHYATIAPVCGVLGVELFFVLSGYLIGGILYRTIQEREPLTLRQIGRFWLRRWMRTLPNYYLFLGFYAALASLTTGAIRGREFIPYPFFLQNFLEPPGTFFQISWSLAVEEWFYLLLPGLFFALYTLLGKRADAKRVIFFACAAILAGFSLILRLRAGDGAGWETGMRMIVVYRFDALMYGVLLAIVRSESPAGWRRMQAMLPIGTALLIVAIVAARHSVPDSLPFLPSAWLLALIPISFALVLPGLSRLQPPSNLWAAGINYVSQCSYSMYLCHLPILFFVLRVGHDVQLGGAGKLLVRSSALVLTLICSGLLYRYLERPILALAPRDQFPEPTVTAS